MSSFFIFTVASQQELAATTGGKVYFSIPCTWFSGRRLVATQRQPVKLNGNSLQLPQTNAADS
jgi:hypothetical protein